MIRRFRIHVFALQMKVPLLLGVALSIISCIYLLPPACKFPVYCDSQLLHHVQMARVFSDSKTFVDYKMRSDANVTLVAFQQLLDQTNNTPTVNDLTKFVDHYFIDHTELQHWTPEDFEEFPNFLETITDDAFRTLAIDIHQLWPTLCKRIKGDVFLSPGQYSIIPVSNGFVVPGGRFRELHYWDSYWIIKGLLISGMQNTARGMIENFIELLRTVGHVPSGSRWYYQERSQPPLLTAMVSLYLQHFTDILFLGEIISALEDELNYWLDTHTASFSKNNKTYTLLRYYAPSAGPRPESYFEDFKNAFTLATTEGRDNFFTALNSATESGWEFSSRWFINSTGGNSGPLLNTKIDTIIPVDLNAIFANALQNVSNYQRLLLNRSGAEHWETLANKWKSNIEEVFWNDEEGIWFDYDVSHQKHRNYFYPSNLAPLWMGVVKKEVITNRAPRIIRYLNSTGVLNYTGGVPTSLFSTGEHWDLPNAWPPLVSLFVNSMEALGTEESKNISLKIAQDWLRMSLTSYLAKDQKFFDRYNAKDPEQIGVSREYAVQEGYGWSIGVLLELLAKYGKNIRSTDVLMFSELPEFDVSLSVLVV